MLKNIERLECIRSYCAAGEPMPSELSTWLSDAIERFIALECRNLEEAFEIHRYRGGVPWWRERALYRRDCELNQLYRRFFACLPVGSAAKEIHTLSARYETTVWPRDRKQPEMPAHYAGTPKAHLWKAFRSGAKMPLSRRRLTTLLTGEDAQADRASPSGPREDIRGASRQPSLSPRPIQDEPSETGG